MVTADIFLCLLKRKKTCVFWAVKVPECESLAAVFRNKLQKARERDISEKIALGLPNTGAGGSSDTQFDSRLFNTSKVTLSGFNSVCNVLCYIAFCKLRGRVCLGVVMWCGVCVC